MYRNVGLLSRSSWEHGMELNDVDCSTAALKTSLTSHTKCAWSVVWTLIDQVGRDLLEVVQSIPPSHGITSSQELASSASESLQRRWLHHLWVTWLWMHSLFLFTQNFFSWWSWPSGPHFHCRFLQHMTVIIRKPLNPKFSSAELLTLILNFPIHSKVPDIALPFS